MRMLWLHAYQSKLWNMLATERVEKGRRNLDHPFAALPGDLVRSPIKSTDRSSSAGVVVEKNHQVMTLGSDSKCATTGADGKYTLEDVMLPVLGRGSVLPTNEFGGWSPPYTIVASCCNHGQAFVDADLKRTAVLFV